MKYRSAFHAWFYGQFAEAPESGALYLFTCAQYGGKDSLVWGLLDRVGEKTYTDQTFLKAAKIVLAEAFLPEEEEQHA